MPIKLCKKLFFLYSINMSNINQNNEMEQISKEISLLQDRLKINKKSQSISKWVNANWKNTSKEGQRTNFSETKKIQKILKDIFKNKIKHIKKRTIY